RLWAILRGAGLLPDCDRVPVSFVRSCRLSNSSPAVPAARLVVVNMPPQLRRRWLLNDIPARRERRIWVTSALVAALMLLTFLGSLFWSYRHHASIAARSNAVTAALPSSKSLETSVVGTPSTAVASDAPAAPSDRDPVANAAAPPVAAGPKPRIDPRSLRN